ncbi:MAG: pentapeptide repeat-containing protein [Anaerolineae bacterium]|nr:pentapeptide repeat-containing protein [Anaerolineae bacterium]
MLLIDRLYQKRDRERQEKELIELLLRQSGSDVNDVACDAIYQLNQRGLLTGDTSLLQGAHLVHANLQHARLTNVNLRNAVLTLADLSYAHLSGVELAGALMSGTMLEHVELADVDFSHTRLYHISLRGSKLSYLNLSGKEFQGSIFQDARLNRINFSHSQFDGWQASDFRHANLWEVDFSNADLTRTLFRKAELLEVNYENANLCEADFRDAALSVINLKSANLVNASLEGVTRFKHIYCSEETILPDHTNWSPSTDMTRFTDPNHLDFWEPEWVKKERSNK